MNQHLRIVAKLFAKDSELANLALAQVGDSSASVFIRPNPAGLQTSPAKIVIIESLESGAVKFNFQRTSVDPEQETSYKQTFVMEPHQLGMMKNSTFPRDQEALEIILGYIEDYLMRPIMPGQLLNETKE